MDCTFQNASYMKRTKIVKSFRSLALKAHANGRNIVGQQVPTLLGPTCCVRLHSMLALVASCWHLLDVVGWCLKLVKHLAQQVPTFLLFCGHRSEAQHCWVHLHRIPNNVGYAQAHFFCFYWDFECRMQRISNEARPTANNVGSCCARLNRTHNTCEQLATTPNIVGPTMLGVVASVCMGLYKWSPTWKL